ncbi:MAG TPA: hypothetical protein VIU14_07415 [Mesorhizobium sp.]|jgi:hypothetical protein
MLCILRGAPSHGTVLRYAVSGGIAPKGEDRIRCARSSMRWLHVSVAELDSATGDLDPLVSEPSPKPGRSVRISRPKGRGYRDEKRN